MDIKALFPGEGILAFIRDDVDTITGHAVQSAAVDELITFLSGQIGSCIFFCAQIEYNVLQHVQTFFMVCQQFRH